MPKKTQVPQAKGRECGMMGNNSPNPQWTEKTFMISTLRMNRNKLAFPILHLNFE